MATKEHFDKLRNRPLTKEDRRILRAILRREIQAAIKANGGISSENEYSTWGRKAQRLYRIFMSVAAEGERDSE